MPPNPWMVQQSRIVLHEKRVDRPFAHAAESGANFRLPGNAWKDTVAMQVHRIFGRLAISASRRGVLMSCQTLRAYVRRNCRPIFYILLTSQGQRFSTKLRSFNGSAALAGFRLFQMDIEIGKVATSDVRNANIKSDRSRADEHERASPRHRCHGDCELPSCQAGQGLVLEVV